MSNIPADEFIDTFERLLHRVVSESLLLYKHSTNNIVC